MTAPTPDNPQVRQPDPPPLWEPSGAVPAPGYVEPPAPGGYPPPPGGYPTPLAGYPVPGYPPPGGGYPPPPGGQPGYQTGHPPAPGYPASGYPPAAYPASGYPPAGYPPPAYPYQPGQPLPPGFAVPPPPGYGAPPRSPAGAPLASFGDRLLAYLIDSAIFTGVGFVLGAIALVVLFAVRGDAILTAPEDDALAVLVPFFIMEAVLIVVVYALLYAYYVEYLRREGQTLGKKVMRLRVVPLSPGETLTRRACVRRFLVQWVAGGLVPFFSYVDGFWQLWDKPYQQCLHDRYARTVVVKVPAS